ncbi:MULTISPECIES: glucose 1-dehydrogenase [unclassified Mesorhizobium]|uniref:SDR family NAD(P)-dependent oxidoreductase n=1 Tax=unclassified Mesorhizobium TaxID=325217 RepID=UPI000FDC5B7E|nr:MULTISPECIES: glucose 1-dehydrogenase [unclassified Mesorhizobium]TGQ29577.1 glucose 1-dehydrogenase [Mesorhizobium sp. M00.F.Ca.ET.216.01.1.1]TIS87374.1 MAG: glucose 1-dehydrogenase [Mesorhizobium sp.]TJW05523.1 MAG: glucose 1-dehydrogenase [Mesorhizobium sp.]TJW42406.1 MAG: glucose 1-dehydrogenase [Mesorhizobium sp.]
MSKLAGKVAIVTGASKGIGASIAKGLAAAGAAVIVNYASSRDGADRVVAGISDSGGRAVAVQGDVSLSADVRRLFEAAISSFGAVDILVNNAGVFEFEPLEAVTEAEFHHQFDINVLGTILTIQEAAKHFGPEGGSVINISSVASLNPPPNGLVYAATKSAVDSITLSMSRELGARNIRVNAIAPGGVDTEGLKRVGVVGSEFEKQIVAMTPLGRFGQPDDVARVAVFLASADASWLTGERITVSGGWR